MARPLGSVGASSSLLRWVDVDEQYGRHVVAEMVGRLDTVRLAGDLGVGQGHDLTLVAERFPSARLVGIDCSEALRNELSRLGVELECLDLERDSLPFGDESVDLLIANQVLEHVKELFWLAHEVARALRVGGSVIIGVPNICALHNRLAFLFGLQPSQMKSYSAHVRGFGPREIPRFFSVCFPGGFRLELYRGPQFYPFSKPVARLLSRLFPGLSHSSFYLMRKDRPYRSEFLEHPVEARLETPFFVGRSVGDGGGLGR